MDMIARKKRLMMLQFAQEQGLPAEYMAVDYLESTGTQWIDTNVSSRPNLSAKYKIAFTRNDVIQQVCAEFINTSSNKIYFPYADNTAWKFSYGLSAIEIQNVSVSANTVYEVEAIYKYGINNVKIIIDGVTRYTGNSSIESMPSKNLFLFASNGSTMRPAYAKIYNFTISDSNTNAKVADFVPCLRISDSKPGMYDLVGRQFYVNAGTGEFMYDTTAKVLHENKILWHTGNTYTESNKTNGGVTVIYKMDTPTSILFPAGIIPTSGDVIRRSEACIFVLDSNQTAFNYVNETTETNGYNRWAQDESGTMTEFSQKWTLVQNYSYIQFTVDIRYLDRAYMYDKTSGQIWFAGVNTPYYGHHNISELS